MVTPLPEGITAIRVPAESELLEACGEAVTRGMYLITDGEQTVISPIIFPGWHRLAVKVKEAA